MKKTILTGAVALFLWTTDSMAQYTMTVDMRTGIVNDVNSPNYPDIPPGSYDDTWQVSAAGGSYGPVYVSNGYNPTWVTNETYEHISPSGAHALSPTLAANYDVQSATVSGDYIYRMRFNFDAHCNTVNSAELDISVLAASGFKMFLLNNTIYTLPSYTSDNYREIDQALAASTHPYYHTAPSQVVTINPLDIHNGTNNIYVFVDPWLYGGTDTPVLQIWAMLNIGYSNNGEGPFAIDMTGSAFSVCNGGTGNLLVNGNWTNYSLGLTPGTYTAAGSTNMVVPVSPPYTTIYNITLKSPLGCVSTAQHRVRVLGCPGSIGYPSISIKTTGVNTNGDAYLGITAEAANADEERSTPGFMNSWAIQEVDPSTGDPIYTVSDASCWYTDPGADMIFPGFDALNNQYQNGDALTCGAAEGEFLFGHMYWISRTVWADGMDPVEYGTMVEVDSPGGSNNARTSTPVGIKENSVSGNGVFVSPNPSTGVFKVKTTLAAGTIEVSNMLGVQLKKIEIKENTSEYVLDLSGFAKGIYLMNTYSNGKKSTQKIIIE